MRDLANGLSLLVGDGEKGTRCESGTVPQRYAGTTAVTSTGRRDWEATASRKPGESRKCQRVRRPAGCPLQAVSVTPPQERGSRKHAGWLVGSLPRCRDHCYGS